MRETSSRIFKQFTSWALILFIIVAFAYGYIVHQNSKTESEIKQMTFAVMSALNTANSLEAEAIEAITKKADAETPGYKKAHTHLTNVRDIMKLPGGSIKILRKKDSMTEVIMDDGSVTITGQSYDLWSEMERVFAFGKTESLLIERDGNKIAVGLAAIKNKSGHAVALVSAQIDYTSNVPSLRQSLMMPLIIAFALFLITLLILYIVLKKLNLGIVSVQENLKRLKNQSPILKSEGDDSLTELFQSMKEIETSIKNNQESDEERTKIQKQIKEFLRIVNSAADGDFTVSAEVTADTFGALADSFNLMISDLSMLIKDTKKAAEQVTISTNGILGNTNTMANGAAEQALKIETISKFAKDMANLVEDTNQSAQNAAQAARSAKEVAEQGSDMVKKSITGMQNTRNSVREASRQVRILGENSARIGEITSFISEIANRTNLLALNASIEAARAGEAGRGFTVVADEVRNLAERSSHSAEEISKLIDDIQTVISKTMEAMENGTREVADGTKMVDSAGEVLREIVGRVEVSANSSVEISNATEEQTRFSQEIVSSIEHIAGIAKETADSAEQSKEATNKLEFLSEELNQTVAKFRLPE